MEPIPFSTQPDRRPIGAAAAAGQVVFVELAHGDDTAFTFESPHHAARFRQSPFYEHLFVDDTIPLQRRPRELAEYLRTHLAKSLPDFMVPSLFVTLAELPLSPTGKVDRRRLPDPEAVRLPSPSTRIAPRTPTEKTVAEIWAEVLDLETVGVDDDFFALGGHSLMATQVVSRVRRVFQRTIPLRLLFESRTIATMAAAIETTDPSPEEPEIETTPDGLQSLDDLISELEQLP